jgi:hypothetical protein
MRRCVNYLISGPGHLPYLAVSLYTLRQYWTGSVHVYAWPESYEIAKQIADDPLIWAFCSEIQPEQRCRLIGGQPFDRIRIMQDNSTKDVGLYLDCDTIVSGDVTPLIHAAESFGFVFTQFCKWVTTGSIVSTRIRRLLGIEGIPQDAVQSCLDESLPSVNTGIFACVPSSPVLDEWHRYIEPAKRLFIGDEITAHAVMARGMPFDQIKTVTDTVGVYKYADHGVAVAIGGEWNCSTKFRPDDLPADDVRIWHGHGDCFTRPLKAPAGVELWWPLFEEVYRQNIGGIQGWVDKIQHKFFQELKAEKWAQ